jgi:excinuclease ABC subunit A
VVAFPTLSLASGAIKGWDRRNGYYFSMLESLAKHYAFDIEAGFDSLPEAVQAAILHGSGEEEIKFSYIMDSGASQGKKVTKKHAFEGIIPNMQRRYRETDSALVREDLGRLRSTQPCPDCFGSRLRKEARHARAIRPAPFTRSATPRCAKVSSTSTPCRCPARAARLPPR